MKKRAGERVRPCWKCRVPVKFIKSPWVTRYGLKKNDWHWVNEDNSHHKCGESMPPVEIVDSGLKFVVIHGENDLVTTIGKKCPWFAEYMNTQRPAP